MKLRYIISILLAVIFASCSNEVEVTQLSTPIALTISAVIDSGTSTRGEASDFKVGDVITVGDGSCEAKYTYDGKEWKSSAPYYFSNTGNVTLSAYADTETDGYLYASASTSYTTAHISFSFDHCMSKLSFSFICGVDVSVDDLKTIKNVKVSGLVNSGSKSNGTAAADKNAATADVDASAIAVADTVVSAYAIVYPQSASSVKLTFTMNAVGYEATVKGVTYSAGTSYGYNVMVSKSAAVVSVNSMINGWSTDIENLSDKETDGYVTYGSLTNAGEGVKLYAIAFNDGSFENILDGTNTMVVPTLTAMQLNNISGIVYYLYSGNERDDDKLLVNDHAQCTHGLIVSLTYAGQKAVWQSECESVTDFYKSDRFAVYNKNLYGSISPTSGAEVKAEEDGVGKFNGYNNTKLLSIYNRYCRTNGKEVNLVLPVQTLENNYALTAPSGSSGWFVPSPTELYKLFLVRNEIDSILKALFPSKSYGLVDDGGSKLIWSSAEIEDQTAIYDSSSERENKSIEYVRVVRFKTTDSNTLGLHEAIKNDSDKSKYKLRPICAF